MSKTRMVLCAAVGVFSLASFSQAAINWDGGGGNSWWFNAPNWSAASGLDQLPPSRGGATDTNINQAVTVEYDPTNDPNFVNANSYPYPSGFGPQKIWRMYLSSSVATTATLNVRGNLTGSDQGAGTAQWIIGRTGTGIVNQYSGIVIQESNNIDLGSSQSLTGSGTPDRRGVWNYIGGTLESGLLNAGDNTTGGMRLGAATLAGAPDTTDGVLSISNTGANGHIRLKNLLVSSGSGNNGSTGTLEFRYGQNPNQNNDGGVRAIQVLRSVVFNNSTANSQSSRLNVVLDANPDGEYGSSGFVPENIGLIDVGYDGLFSTAARTGTLYDLAGTTEYAEGSIISATGPDGYIYRWTLSYTGLITWADAGNSVLGSVTGPGTGTDIVLIGLNSTRPAVPEPAAMGLIPLAGFLAGRRRK